MRIAKSKYKHRIQCMRVKPDKVERCLWRLPPLSRQNSPTPEVAPIYISSFFWIGFCWQHNIDGIEFTHVTLFWVKIFISFDSTISDINRVKLMINSIANAMQPCLHSFLSLTIVSIHIGWTPMQCHINLAPQVSIVIGPLKYLKFNQKSDCGKISPPRKFDFPISPPGSVVLFAPHHNPPIQVIHSLALLKITSRKLQFLWLFLDICKAAKVVKIRRVSLR